MAATAGAIESQGFSENINDTVICRMRLGSLIVDFMPDDPGILGFSNRWYGKGIETADRYGLTETLEIRCRAPALFVATKLEAYRGRGNNDLYTSRDAEDILLVVDGREELIGEVAAADKEVRAFIGEHLDAIVKNLDFGDFLAGNIREPGRPAIVRERFAELIHACGN
jgi:hypothetical protein